MDSELTMSGAEPEITFDINSFIKDNWLQCSDKELADILGISENAVEHRRRKLHLNRVAEGVTEAALGQSSVNKLRLGKLNDLLEKSNIDLDDIEVIKSARVNSWQAMCKGENGEPRVVDLESSKISFTPKKSKISEPEWPVIQPAAPVVVHTFSYCGCERSEFLKSGKKNPDMHVTLAFSDAHFGFRQEYASLSERIEWWPFHDEEVLEFVLQVADEVKPDVIVNAGDFLDLPSHSKFDQEPSFSGTMQKTLDTSHAYLARLSAIVPDAKKIYLEGNHDIRLSKHVMANACASFGLRPANTPASWPVLSIPHLLRLEELGWVYLDGWPNNSYYVNESCKVIHGKQLQLGKVADSEFVSVVQGHSHRVAQEYRTRRTQAGSKTSFYAMIGCCARVDGSLPSTRSSLDLQGRPLCVGNEDWQQGFALIYTDKVKGLSWLEQVSISNHVAMWRGKEYYL